MKKVIRLAALCLSVVMLIFSFCGCNAIDELRATHGFYTDSRIELGEYTYLELPYCEDLSPKMTELKMINVTEKDVPLLLSAFLGEYMSMSDDEIFLVGDINTEDDIYEDKVYCRSDRYDEIVKKIENGYTFVGYGYDYYVYDEDYNMTDHFYELTDEQMKAVDTVIATAEATKLPENISMDYDYYIGLFGYSEDRLFSKYFADIYVYNGKYSISQYVGEDTIIYEVPKKMNATFEEIMSKYVENEAIFEDF